ncbi:MAG: hypothetical protein ABSC23_03655 [Bryobacteraceae bacterium]
MANEYGAADALMAIFGMKRVKARRSKPRRGRGVDKAYLAWIAKQPCMISGRRATVHHVRRFGEPKDDRRTLPLAPEFHQIQAGPESSIEALGKAKFEDRYGVDIEASIKRYNARYDRETGK